MTVSLVAWRYLHRLLTSLRDTRAFEWSRLSSIYSGTGRSATKSDVVDPNSGGAFPALYHAPEVLYLLPLHPQTAPLASD